MELIRKKVPFDDKNWQIPHETAHNIYVKFKAIIDDAFLTLKEKFARKYQKNLDNYIKYNNTLYQYAIIDTLMDINRLIEFHPVDPNSVKYFSYFIFWFVNRKPYSLREEYTYDLIAKDFNITEEQRIFKELDHFHFFNEYICSQFLYSNLFDNDKPSECETCKNNIAKRDNFFDIWKKEKNNFFYYLTYRNINQKSIESYLRAAVTLHPLWDPTLKFIDVVNKTNDE